jgi:hypothetical protein
MRNELPLAGPLRGVFETVQKQSLQTSETLVARTKQLGDATATVCGNFQELISIIVPAEAADFKIILGYCVSSLGLMIITELWCRFSLDGIPDGVFLAWVLLVGIFYSVITPIAKLMHKGQFPPHFFARMRVVESADEYPTIPCAIWKMHWRLLLRVLIYCFYYYLHFVFDSLPLLRCMVIGTGVEYLTARCLSSRKGCTTWPDLLLGTRVMTTETELRA